jgi:hypothetical protein
MVPEYRFMIFLVLLGSGRGLFPVTLTKTTLRVM